MTTAWLKIIQIAVTVLVAVINLFSSKKAEKVKAKYEKKKTMVESDKSASDRFKSDGLPDSNEPREDI